MRLRIIPNFPDHYYPVAAGSTEYGRSLEPFPFSIRELGSWGEVSDLHIDPHRASVSEFVAWGGMVNRKNCDAALIEERDGPEYAPAGRLWLLG